MKTIELKMPQLGESVTEGVLTSWLVKAGDEIAQYDPVAEVENDKVVTEIPASEGGTVKELLVQENETVPVDAPIMTLAVAGEATEAAAKPAPQAPEKVTEETPATVTQSNEPEKPKPEPAAGKPRFSPAVLSLAQAHDIDLNQLTGTGKHQRITRKDVQRAIEQKAAAPTTEASKPAPTKPAKPAVPKPAVKSADDSQAVPASNIRKTIARNMLQSVHEIPQAWTMIEVDVTNLAALRNQNKAAFKADAGFSLSYFPFFVKAVAQSLKRHQRLNSSWQDNQIIHHDDINLGIAVATDDALYVPVIKHADRLSIAGIAHEINRLATSVREGKLTAADMSGGTFTVNNTGSFGSVASMGIINYPQAAILQVETIRREVAVTKDNQIGIRQKVNLCLTLDHRLLDGLAAGHFLNDLKQILENYQVDTEIY